MPIKNSGYNRSKIEAKQERKRIEAEKRQDAYDAIPIETRVAQMGAKQLARWNKQQANKKAPAPEPVKVVALPPTEPATAPAKKMTKAQQVKMAKKNRPAKS